MHHRHRTVLGSLVTSLCLISSTGMVAANAAAAPRVSLTPAHTSIKATAKASFAFRARDARAGSRVVLQIKRGHSWASLAAAAAHRGTFTGTFRVAGPGRPGTQYYRAILRHGKQIDAGSGPRKVLAFATVSLHALCVGVLDNDCEAGTTTLPGGSTFHYTMLTGINEPGDPFTAQFGAAATSCRSLQLRYVSDSPDHTNTYLELRQPGRKAQRHTTSSAGLSSFAVTLTGGRFGISVEQDASQTFMYFNGSGYCYTSDGKA